MQEFEKVRLDLTKSCRPLEPHGGYVLIRWLVLRQAEPDLQKNSERLRLSKQPTSGLKPEYPTDWIDFLSAHRAASQPSERVNRLERRTDTATRSTIATRVTRVDAGSAGLARCRDPRQRKNRSNTARTCEDWISKVRTHRDVVNVKFRHIDRPEATA